MTGRGIREDMVEEQETVIVVQSILDLFLLGNVTYSSVMVSNEMKMFKAQFGYLKL
jgi:hypothetical protein